MNAKVMLNKALVMAYLSGQVGGMDMTLVDEAINNIVDNVELPESTFAIDQTRDALVAIIGLIKDVLKASKDMPYSRDSILKELSVICGESSKDIYDSFVKTLPSETADASEKRTQLLQALNSASRVVRENDIRKVINSANIAITVNKDKMFGLDKFIDDHISKLTELQMHNSENDPAITSEVNFSTDRLGVEDIFQKQLDLDDSRTVWKLNWDAFNKAFQGGPRPGDTVLIGAMQHNYKSSLTMTMFRGLAVYNKASDFDRGNGKKPTISRISFEDPMVNNMGFLAINILWNKQIKDNTAGKIPIPDISTLDKSDLTDIVMNEMSKNGWGIHMAKVNGDDWTYKDLAKKIISLEADGYDVRAQILDYFLLISKRGLDASSMGSDARNLLRKIRDLYASKDILGISPTQLSPAIKKLLADGVVDKNDLLPYIKDLGMFSESSKLPEEPAIVMYCNKVVYDGATYLHMLVEKHRYIKTLTNHQLWSWYMKFPSNGLSIPDDIDGSLGVCTYRPPRVAVNNF